MANINQKLADILNPSSGVGVGRKEEQADLYELLADERRADRTILYASATGAIGVRPRSLRAGAKIVY